MAKFLVDFTIDGYDSDEEMVAACCVVLDEALRDCNASVKFIEYVGDRDVLLTQAQYNSLVESEQHLAILECRGVDNWEGYCSLPSRKDYDTENEWYDAIYKASESW